MPDEAGTHIPILCKAFENSDGPILEMGTGLFSTPILDMLCKQKQKRRILSLENDTPWWAEAYKKYQSSYHDVIEIGYCSAFKSWDEAPIDDTFWGLVLIDHRPAHRRHVDAIRLKHKAYYILLHDSELADDRAYRYDKIWPHFKYRYDFKECKPHTTILSNFSNLKELYWI